MSARSMMRIRKLNIVKAPERAVKIVRLRIRFPPFIGFSAACGGRTAIRLKVNLPNVRRLVSMPGKLMHDGIL